MEGDNKPHRNYEDRDGNSFFAFLLLAAGTIFLLNNFGVIDWRIWYVLQKLWPLFLVSWGLNELAGNSKFLNFLFGLLGFAISAAIVILALSQSNSEVRNWVYKNFPIWRRYENYFNYQNPNRYYFEEDFGSGDSFRI